MPKVVCGVGSWKAVEVPGELASDGNFAFLSSVEECLPIENEVRSNSNFVDKKAKQRKRKSITKDDVGLNRHVQKKKKLKKPRRNENWSVSNKEDNDNIRTADITATNTQKNPHSFPDDIDEEATEGMINWANLDISETVLKAIADMGFIEPTEIQRLVIPCALRNRCDIIGAAETGSGKTLAFGIPIVEHLLSANNNTENDEKKKGIRALILAPTRELVVQIYNHMRALLKYTSFKIASIVGGLSLQKQERILKYVPEIVVATPGRFLALMTLDKAHSFLSNWSNLQCLVVDETDRMTEKGHFEDLQEILMVIKKSAIKKLQTFVFSATLTYIHPAPKKHRTESPENIPAEDKISRLIEIIGIRKEKYKIIDITGKRGTAETIVETRITCKNLLEKDTTLVYLLKRYAGRTLVFTNSVDASRRLHGILLQLEHKPVALMLHAKMTQKKRLSNLERFASEENSILLATDVAARGLDIRDVEHVIHYQVPKTAELYIHRCGRTARAAKEGLAVLLVDPQDVHFYRRICKNLRREKDLPIFPVDSPELYSILREQVEVATAVETIIHRLKKVQSKQMWFKKAAVSADLDLDESNYKEDAVAEMSENLQREKKALCITLKHLLSQPLPISSVHIEKTRYVSAKMASNYDRSLTQSAIVSLMENKGHEESLIKKCRKVFARHYKHSTNKKKRRQ